MNSDMAYHKVFPVQVLSVLRVSWVILLCLALWSPCRFAPRLRRQATIGNGDSIICVHSDCILGGYRGRLGGALYNS